MVFVYEWKLRGLQSSKDNAHAYIHKKQKKFRNVFIYKIPDTFQKAKQFSFRFCIKKAEHLTLRDFNEIFEVCIYIQKAWHLALGDVFEYKKQDTSEKAKQFAINFIYKNPGLLRYLIFDWIFEICGGRGRFIYSQNNILCVTFLYWKNNALCVMLIYPKDRTLCVTF